MDNFNISVDADGVALITFDVPGRSMNTITGSVQRDLDQLAGIIRTDPAIRGAVLTSGKASGFCAGADLGEMLGDIERWRIASTQDELRDAVADAGGLSRRIRALETCGKPLAAAIGGLALGGGLELALGCHYRVAIDDPRLHLAFPETGIGLIPGAGGTQRLPRLMGTVAALSYLLDGTPIPPAEALSNGIVHALASAGDLVETARRWILDKGAGVAPWDEKGFKLPGGGPHGPAGYQAFAPALAARLGAGDDEYPAQASILRAVYEGVQVPIDAALRIESRYFFNTARSPRAKAMVDTFFTARQALAKLPVREDVGECLAKLRAACATEAAAMLAEGVPPAVVANIARVTTLGPAVTIPHSNDRSAGIGPVSIAALKQRFLYVQAVAAARCVAAGMVRDPRELNAAAIRAGFPRWTGGPLSLIGVEGTADFQARATALAARHGDRFAMPDDPVRAPP